MKIFGSINTIKRNQVNIDLNEILYRTFLEIEIMRFTISSVINHLIKYTHNIIQHDASLFSLLGQRALCLQYLTLLRIYIYTEISNRG